MDFEDIFNDELNNELLSDIVTLGNFDLKLGQTLSAAQGLGPCTQTNQNGVPK